MGWHDEAIKNHPIFTHFFWFIAIAVFLGALLEKRKSIGGFMQWKDGFITSITMGIIMILLAPIAQIFIFLVITPDYFETAINHAVQTGMGTEEEARGYYNLRSFVFQSMIMPPLVSSIIGSLVSLYIEKKKPERKVR